MKVSALLSSEWKGILISMPVTIPTSENYHIKQRKPSIKKKKSSAVSLNLLRYSK